MRPDTDPKISSIEMLGKDLAVAFERVELAEFDMSASGPTVDRSASPNRSIRARVARRLNSRRRRIRVWASTATALTVLIAGVFATLDRDAGPLSTSQALAKVARGAVEQPLPFAREDQFVYTRSENSWMTMFMGGAGPDGKQIRPWAAMQSVDRRAWVSVERFGVSVERRGGMQFVTERDRRLAKETNSKFGDESRPAGQHVMGLAPNRGYFMDGDSGRLTREELLNYPTDPETIYARALRGLHGAGQGDADGVWQSLTSSLIEDSLPPDLRAGMVRAIGLIPGVESLGERTDPLGRPGLAFGRVHAGTRDEALFDPRTSMLLYSRSVLTERGGQGLDGWPAGTVIGRTLNLEQAVVDEPPARYAKRPR